jgi:hypothetical protein
MADDEDAIYIDVVPRVDDSAADSAVNKLRDKFKDVAADVGPDFLNALNSSGVLEELGTRLGGALADPLKDLSDTIGLDLENPLVKLLHKDVGGALDDIVGQLDSKLDGALGGLSDKVGLDLHDALGKALDKDWGGLATSLGKGVGDKLTDALGINDLLGSNGLDSVIDKVHTVTDAVKSLRSGDLGGALQGANALTGGAVQPLADLHDQVKQTVGDTKDLIEDTIGAGWLGSKAAGATKLFAEAAAPVAGSMALTGPVEDQLNKIPWVQDHTPLPGSGGDFLKAPFRMIAGDVMHPSRLGNEKQQYDSNGNFIGDGPPQQNSTDRLYGSIFGGESSGTGGGGGKTMANVAEVQSNSAVVTAGSVSLGGNISIPGMGAAAASSGGGRSTSTGIGTTGGDSGSMASLYSGGSGTTIGKSHFASGGVLPGGSPGYDNMIGVLPGGSAVGLEGGEGVINPSAMQRPGVADLISSLNQHYDEGTGAAGVGGDPNNTTLSTPPTQPNAAGDDTGNGPKQQQQLGSGSGGGISGGGIIGAAEQAGVAAAGIGGFGGGAIAAQMAVQESNLLVQKATQNVAALATAPFETFGLTGGQMGAPTVNPMGGWIGKLIAGELGSQSNLPNLAGASTQPPKKPDQKQPGDDQQGQGETPTGPSGAKDDPMHVNVTNQATAPQGTSTSSMNMTPLAVGM